MRKRIVDIDAQGLTVSQFEELLCDCCLNAPLAYYCPACDYKCCSDCLRKAFRKKKDSLECKNCGHVDKHLETFVGPDKV